MYCAGGINNDGKIVHRYAESIPSLILEIEKLKAQNLNVYVTPSTFTGYRRIAKSCAFVRSFFIDLDVGAGDKKYATKEEALTALDKFVVEQGLPPPIRVDSGTGVHAYWAFEEDVPAIEWIEYARKFKEFVSKYLKADPAVTADAARLMRTPSSFNHRHTPPREVRILSSDVYEYDFAMFKEFIQSRCPTDNVSSAPSALTAAEKGIDDDTKAVSRSLDDNYEYLFEVIARRSLEGSGCNQIRNILINAKTLPEPLWWAGLNIAHFCDDGETAIHKISEDHDEYTFEDTVRKIYQRNSKSTGPITCTYFASLAPEHCAECSYRGKITTPKQLGKQLRVIPIVPDQSDEASEGEVWSEMVGQAPSEGTYKLTSLPTELFPFSRGVNGGIYYQPPSVVDKKGVKHEDAPIRLTPHDLYPIKRIYSPLDGECLTIRNEIPKDPVREFLLPMKYVYATEKLREILASNSVFPDSKALPHFMDYFVKWGQHLLNVQEAEQMRMQMGWTETKSAFVLGNREIRPDGSEFSAPASPYVKGLAKLLVPEGDYDLWKKAAQELNRPSLEVHAFTMLCGFASPLMHMTSTSGVTIGLVGDSGAAKTGALYGALSVWGQPKGLAVLGLKRGGATENGFVGRYLGLHNLPFGLDEVANRTNEELSDMVHKISQGKSKIRMQASVNAERELEMDASMIAIMTSNHSIYNRLEQLRDDPNGEVARLIEIFMTKPEYLKVDPDAGQRIFDVFRLNYGFAGVDFIKYYYKNGNSIIKKQMDYWNTRFRTDFGFTTEYRFYENLIKSGMTSGFLVKEANIIDYDLDRIYNRMMHELISIRDKTVRVNQTDFKAIVGEFILDNLNNALIINDGKIVTEPRGNGGLVMRVDISNQITYVSKTKFKEFLAEKQIGTRAFEKGLEAENILTYIGRQRLSTGWRSGMSAPPVHVYGFKGDIPEEVLNASNKQA